MCGSLPSLAQAPEELAHVKTGCTYISTSNWESRYAMRMCAENMHLRTRVGGRGRWGAGRGGAGASRGGGKGGAVRAGGWRTLYLRHLQLGAHEAVHEHLVLLAHAGGLQVLLRQPRHRTPRPLPAAALPALPVGGGPLVPCRPAHPPLLAHASSPTTTIREERRSQQRTVKPRDVGRGAQMQPQAPPHLCECAPASPKHPINGVGAAEGR